MFHSSKGHYDYYWYALKIILYDYFQKKTKKIRKKKRKCKTIEIDECVFHIQILPQYFRAGTDTIISQLSGFKKVKLVTKTFLFMQFK